MTSAHLILTGCALTLREVTTPSRLRSANKELTDCEVGCTACGKCDMDAPDDLITMENNLPVINYAENHNTKIPIERCPTGAIVWLDDKGNAIKGKESKKVIRKGVRSMGSS